MNEPKWTTHRVTMPEDMALDYLERLLPIVNKEFLDPGYPIALSMAIDKMRAPLPDTKALTVEELRGMDGQPVWVVSTEMSAGTGWYLLGKYYDGTICMHCADNTLYEKGLWRGSFVAYRRPPEKEE